MLPNLDFIKTVLNGVNLKLGKALGIAKNAVLKTEQKLTDSEKKIARDNIAAASIDSVEPFTVFSLGSGNVAGKETMTIDKSFLEIQNAILSGRRCQLRDSVHYYPLVKFGKGYNITFGDDYRKFIIRTTEKVADIETSKSNKGYFDNIGLRDASTGYKYNVKIESGALVLERSYNP